jgi:single-strand DNA-binding protein
MKSVNKVILIGNLVRDPEVTQINSTTDVAKFTIAMNESYKKPDGQLVENTTYIDCEAWSGLAKVVGNYMKKGSKVYIEGSIRADVWQDADSGKNRTKHKIRITDLVMLDSKGGGGGSSDDDAPSYSRQESKSSTPAVNAVDDDELPF